jgi:hypothetical protein
VNTLGTGKQRSQESHDSFAAFALGKFFHGRLYDIKCLLQLVETDGGINPIPI